MKIGDWNIGSLGGRNMMMPLLMLTSNCGTDGWEGEFNQDNRCDKINKYKYLQMPVRKSTDKD
jgi:hypothetical protein